MRVSTGGGFYPKWRKDARELFYVRRNKLMAVDVKLGETPEVGAPQALFEAHLGPSEYAPFADGHRFLFIEPAGEPSSPEDQRRVEPDRRAKPMNPG